MTKEKKMKIDENTNILIDESVLKKMFEGSEEDKAKPLMMMMKQMNDEGKKLIVKVPMSHFLRAIFFADPNMPIKNIQKVLSFAKIIPSFADFKNKEECTKEILMIADMMSKRGGKKKNGK